MALFCRKQRKSPILLGWNFFFQNGKWRIEAKKIRKRIRRVAVSATQAGRGIDERATIDRIERFLINYCWACPSRRGEQLSLGAPKVAVRTA